MKDAAMIKANGLDSWECVSQWAYEGKYEDKGYLYNQGTSVTCDDAAILPAITVDLEKASYQKTTSVESTDVNNN